MKFKNILITGYAIAAGIILTTIYFAVHSMLLNTKEVGLLIVTTILALLAGFALNLFLFKDTFSALKNIQHASRAATKKDFSPIANINSPQELKLLANDFNYMLSSLQDSFDKLEKSELEKNEMVAQLTHDIKTPITSISLTINAINDGIIEANQYNEYFKIINDQVIHLNALVEELGTVANLDGLYKQSIHDKSKANIEKFFLDQLLVEVLGEFQAQLKAGNHYLELKGVNNALELQTNKVKLMRIISNLVGNALKYSNPGTSISVFVEPDSIEGYNLRVQNTGMVISDFESAKIFDRLYRIDKSRNPETGGHGMGLYIAKRLAKEINGELTLEYSNDDKTSFKLYLPNKLFSE